MSRRAGAGIALLVSALVLVGCDRGPAGTRGPSPAASGSPSASATSSALSPTALLHRAVRTSEEARSVRVRGKGKDHGDTVTIDMRISGHRASGHIWVNRQRADVIRIRSVVYISGNARFLRAWTGQRDVSAFRGKYRKTSAHDRDFADMLPLTEIPGVLSEVTKPTGHVTRGARTSYRGVPAIPLLDESGGTLYVAATGKPYVIGLRGAGEYLDFTGYGDPTAIKPPPRDRVLRS